MRFQGGASSFISGRKQLTDLYSFASDNTDVIENKSQFSALNFRQEINSKLDVEGFAIFSKLFTSTLTESSIEYLQNTTATSEERINKGENKSILGIGNVKLNYTPNTKEKWFYNGQFQSSANDMTSVLNSRLDGQQTSFETLNSADNVQIKQFLEWHKQINLKINV